MILQGNNLIIKLGGKAIAASKSCDISINVDTNEVANNSDGEWRKFITGRKSWQITASQLVTSVSESAQMAGKSMAIEVSLRGSIGKAFNGFVNGVSVYPQPLSGTPMSIYWDKTLKKFVGYINPGGIDYYFDSWTNSDAYTSPSAYGLFSYNGVTYTWLGDTLTAEKLTGNVICTTWRGTFTRGNLAQGSFDFLGNGALTPATLP